MGTMDFTGPVNPDSCAPGTDKYYGNDYKYLKQLTDNNFNLILPYHQLLKPTIQYASSSPSKAFLDTANMLGLKVLLNCPGLNIDKYDPDPEYDSTESNSALNYYGNHPAVIGYHIIDEPVFFSTCFDEIKEYADDIENYNSSQIRFTDIRGMYHEHDDPEDFEAYVDSFISFTNPNFISSDYYLFKSSDLTERFYHLDIVAQKARVNNLPHLNIVWIKSVYSPGDTYVGKSIEEFNYANYSNLVYGVKGLFYWARESQVCPLQKYPSYKCQSPNWLGENRWDKYISSNTKEYLKGLHQKLIDNSNTLLSLDFMGAYHKSPVSTINPNLTEELPSYSAWSNFDDNYYANQIFDVEDPLTAQGGSSIDSIVISFLVDQNNNYYFWIFNKSMVSDEEIQMNFKENTALIDILNNKIYPESTSRVVYLDKGEAKLFEINKDYLSNVTICTATYNPRTYSDVWGENITIGGSSCDVEFLSGSSIAFKGETITIGDGVVINEGSKVMFKPAIMGSGTLKVEYLDELTNIEDPDNSDLIIYPNPNNGQFYISLPADMDNTVSIQMYNIVGTKVADFARDNETVLEIDLSGTLEKGTYFIRIADSKSFYNEKIIIQ